MDLRLFITVFASVFVAELGDKTQLATLLFAADAPHARGSIFAGAATALVLSSAIGVVAGSFLSAHVSREMLRWVAGCGFVAIGLWVLVRG